jgi:adenylate cyclase
MMATIATSDTYRFGPYRLQARGTGLYRRNDDGSWVHSAIGSRALDLLLLLLRRPGEVLSRDEIMDAVWPSIIVEASNLTVQIAALRRILDQEGSDPSCIQTISGRGYRFLPTVTTETGDAPVVDVAAVAHAPQPDPRRRLSVIVLPFTSRGDDADADNLADAITDDLASDLSRLPGALVIARAPSCGVNYCIQGSVWRIADRTRVNVHLLDMETGAHLWGERFDVDRAGNVDVRDEIIGRLVRSLTVKLVEHVNRRIEAVSPKNWTADDLVMRGRAFASRPLSEANRHEALSCFEHALARNPDCVSAKLSIAAVLVSNVFEGWSRSAEQAKARAEELLVDALREDANLSDGHVYMGLLRRLQGRLADSRTELEIAVALSPHDAIGTAQLGATLTFLGEPEAALPYIRKSIRLAPHDRGTPISHSFLGLCQMMLGHTQEAIICLRTARAVNPRLYYTHMLLAAALGLAGDLDEASAALRQAIKLQPEIRSLAGIRARWQKRASSPFDALCENTVSLGLQRAGLPQDHVRSGASVTSKRRRRSLQSARIAPASS